MGCQRSQYEVFDSLLLSIKEREGCPSSQYEVFNSLLLSIRARIGSFSLNCLILSQKPNLSRLKEKEKERKNQNK